MYFPACYALLLCSPANWTLCFVWEVLYPANIVRPWNTLLKWLWAVSMGTATLMNSTFIGASTALVSLQVPLIDEDLIMHRLWIQRLVLHQHLEALEWAITQDTNENHQVHEERTAHHMRLSLPSASFMVTVHILQGFANARWERLTVTLA